MSTPSVRPAMLTWALRYALGRHSYAVDDVASEVSRHLPHLSDGQLDTIGRDLTEHIARADATRLAGARPDAAADGDDQRWAQLLGQVFAEHRRRAQPEARS